MSLLQAIDTNISIQNAKIMKKELEAMGTDMLLYELQIKNINKSYRRLLMKDEPVGSSINAVKNIKQKENKFNL